MKEWEPDSWCVLRCKENSWKSTISSLKEAGVEINCPLIHERKKRKDANNCYRLVRYPAFPGYLFIRFNPQDILLSTIKRIPGTMDFVRSGRKISTITNDNMESILLAMHKIGAREQYGFTLSNLPEEERDKIDYFLTKEKPADRINFLLEIMN